MKIRRIFCLFCAIALLFGIVICALHSGEPTEPTEPSKYRNPTGLPDELIYSLKDCLNRNNSYVPSFTHSFSEEISTIISCLAREHIVKGQLLQVECDPENYYYVCGYFNSLHENEIREYCCAAEYLWVKFDTAEDISELYNGEKFVIAFQINKTSLCQDVVPLGIEMPTVELFQMYPTNFVEGFNTAVPHQMNDAFIYLRTVKSDEVYFATGSLPLFFGFPYVKIDGERYAKVEMYTEDKTGKRHEKDLQEELGKYYGALSHKMVKDKYSETDENGNTVHYGLIKVKDIVHIVKKELNIGDNTRFLLLACVILLACGSTAFVLVRHPRWRVKIRDSVKKLKNRRKKK